MFKLFDSGFSIFKHKTGLNINIRIFRSNLFKIKNYENIKKNRNYSRYCDNVDTV
jgi:hypothetical protein